MDWVIEGSGGEAIHGTTQEAVGGCRGNVVISHGFKGYKDYGMFPWIATSLARGGMRVHRFNFSHSGMLGEDGPFERPDLFERDTWNRQVEDLIAVCDHVDGGGPLTLLGHSRGGVACLLAAGRGVVVPRGIITLSSPSTCNALDEETQQTLLRSGFIESPSSRTGQMLRIGAPFLQEQIDDPAGHDLLPLVATIPCPIAVIHGEDDPTVPVTSAENIAAAAQCATVTRIPGGDHVFNTPNPFPRDGSPSPQLAAVLAAIKQSLDSK
jgi:pimeloyl-ACP methyl ester carboxylesterase